MKELQEKLPLPPSNLTGLEPGFREARIIRDVVCYNQGALFEYHYIGAKLHRELRRAQQSASANSGLPAGAQSDVQEAMTKLLDFLDGTFREIVRNNFLYLDYFFECVNSSDNHRTSLMLPTDSAGIGVIDLYRHPLNSASFNVRDTSKFTAFSEVKKTGSFYLCNNIPLKLQKGSFYAPRLKKELSVPDQCTKKGQGEFDPLWLDFWEDADSSKASSDPYYRRSFYKSTLVIPLTFTKNAHAFSDTFFDMYNGDPLYDSIFGYLCFDSVEIDYFKSPSCVDIGYVVSDHICYLLILRRLYTMYSETFNELKKSITPLD